MTAASVKKAAATVLAKEPEVASATTPLPENLARLMSPPSDEPKTRPQKKKAAATTTKEVPVASSAPVKKAPAAEPAAQEPVKSTKKSKKKAVAAPKQPEPVPVESDGQASPIEEMQIVEKPAKKGKKQAAKATTNVEITPAQPKPKVKAPLSVYETSAAVAQKYQGGIGAELSMDWDVTVQKVRNVVDTHRSKPKRKYDSSSSEEDRTLSDWEGVEDFQGKSTVRFEAPPKGTKARRELAEKPAAEPAHVDSDEYYDSEEESEEEQQEPTPPPPKKEKPPQNDRPKNGKPQEPKKKDGPAQNTRSNSAAKGKKQPAKKPAPAQKNQGKGNGNKAAVKK